MKQLHLISLSFFFLLITNFTIAQAPPGGTFGGFFGENQHIRDEITPEQRASIIKILKANTADLKKRGVIKENKKENGITAVKFGHPLRQAAGNSKPGYYGISGFVDTAQNSTAIKDFNCGTRTYDGHMGTDFFTFPFPWAKMEANAVEIIAAADGVIIYRQSAMPDKNCAMCNDQSPANCWYWNAVYIRNTDGTISWYGHMKAGSLTTKTVGQSVTKGEFLGVVGSSGSSSGPHLHFEVWNNDTYTKLLDPWAGNCNVSGPTTESMWENQEPYYTPMVLEVTTASAMPVPYSCYNNGNGEKSYLKNTFNLGEMVYLPVYIRDNIPGSTGFGIKLIKPSGYTFSWNLANFNVYYASAWFYYNYNQSTIDEAGEWKFQVTYGGKMVEHKFLMLDPLPLKLISFTGQKQDNLIHLEWQTANEQNIAKIFIERSENGEDFKSIGEVSGKGGNTNTINNYSFDDQKPFRENNFYRLKMSDQNGADEYSNIVQITFDQKGLIVLFPNPARNEVTIKGVMKFQRLTIKDMYGKKLIQQAIRKNNETVNISSLADGVYIIQLSNETESKSIKLIKKK